MSPLNSRACEDLTLLPHSLRVIWAWELECGGRWRPWAGVTHCHARLTLLLPLTPDTLLLRSLGPPLLLRRRERAAIVGVGGGVINRAGTPPPRGSTGTHRGHSLPPSSNGVCTQPAAGRDEADSPLDG